MKKLFSALIILASVLMLSGCFFYVEDTPSSPRYDIACHNNTLKTITDWCVKKGEDFTYANSDFNCKIESGKTDKIENLSKGYYSICISFAEKKQLHPNDYEQTNEIYLDEDVTFDVAERKFYSRAAGATSIKNEEPQYVIVLSNGKEYLLK